MAKKPTVTTVSSGYQSTTTINNNFQNIRNAFDNTLSLDGSTPNAMQADFDMGNNDILNVNSIFIKDLRINGTPVSPGSLVYNGVTKETQTATSGQTVFNLTTLQYTPGINNLSVYIDGIYQNPSTYTETNSTRVTFSAGLHVGAVVDFVVLAINDLAGTLASTNVSYSPGATSLYGISSISVKSALDQISHEGTGSSKIGFLQAGTGAVNRTVQNKLREVISVKDFGAVGDGVTDDTAAIQAAITYAESTATPPAAGPGQITIFFPFGKYKITNELLVTKSISFVGDGHSEYSTGSRILQLNDTKDHFRVVPVSTGCSCSWDELILLGATAGATLTACINITKVGVGCNSIRIRNCVFGTPQAFAIKIQAADDVVIDGNLFDVAGLHGIALGTTTAADAVSNCIISNNNFFDVAVKCILAYNVDGLLITNNRVYNATFTTDVFLDGLDTTPYQLKNIVVNGNSFKNVNCLAMVEDIEGFTFTGNSGSLLGNGASSVRSCISINGACTDIVVVGNRLSGEYNAKYFYDDFNASTYYGFSLGSNIFRSTGTTTTALSAYNGIGSIVENSFVGFTNPCISQQWYTSTSAITPGTLAAGATYSYTATVNGARQGDKVTITPADATWPINAGVIINPYVSAINTVTLKYTNVTSGSIVVPAHDFGILVTR